MAILVMNTSRAAPDTMSIAGYFPDGPLLFARTPHFKKLLPMIKNHPVTKAYLGSGDDEQFRRSKLYLKMRDRIRDVEKLTGFGVSYGNLMELAGDESALALYNIFDLKVVFISAVSREKVYKSRLFAARQKLEERKLGDQVYWAVSDEHGTALAFAVTGKWLVLSNDLERFEHSLGLLAGQRKGGSLADSSKFKSALPEAFAPGDLTVVMDQSELNDNLYFKTYWVHQNEKALGWIKGETLDLKISKGVIEERGWYSIDNESPGAPGQVDISGLAKWPDANWIDVRQVDDPRKPADVIVRWVMGETGKEAEKTIEKIAGLIAPSNPEAVARIDASGKERGGFWFERRRLVAVSLGDPGRLNKSDFLKEVASRWSERLGTGGLLNPKFINRGGIQTLDLPLIEGTGPSIYIKGKMLIVSNDAGLVKEFLNAKTAPGLAKGASGFTYADLNQTATLVADYYLTLAGRSNWRYVGSENFFQNQAPSLLGAIGKLDKMTVNGRVENGRYFRHARFELAK